MNIWFSSDLHFGHENILKKFCPTTRLGNTVDEMDQIIVDNIRRLVQEGDQLYWLGDIFFYKDVMKAHDIMDQLPVVPKLIWGNHDELIANSLSLQQRFEILGHWADVKINGRKVILHHFPTFEWHKMWAGAYHLYGHVHSRYGELEHPAMTGRCMDVGIDSRPGRDMTMWSWNEIDAILSKRKIREKSTDSEIEAVKAKGG